jgi:pentatricopeptide repeat protein
MASVSALHSEVLPTFQYMLRAGLQPNLETFKSLMKYYYMLQDTEKLQEMFEKMLEKSVYPSAEVCFFVIDALAQKGDTTGVILYYAK